MALSGPGGSPRVGMNQMEVTIILILINVGSSANSHTHTVLCCLTCPPYVLHSSTRPIHRLLLTLLWELADHDIAYYWTFTLFVR